ncbi:MAG: DUF1318 domain-containing protein [Candidatus Hydrogenedentes bacterium]|nr:DUF1318 domain-containing protein [Candidatus Hydrogenedentota bacterium]
MKRWAFSNIFYALFILVLMHILLLVPSCGTIGSFVRLAPDYSALPEDDIINVAKVIESAVWNGKTELEVYKVGSINLDTPQIRQAIKTRGLRSQLVKELLNSGFIYEQNGGLIAILRTSEYKKKTTRHQRDKNALIVMSENNDRWALYEGILKANNYPSKSLSAIKDAFYKARVEILEPGQKYQTVDGDIVSK